MSHRAFVPLTSIVLVLAIAPACGTRNELAGYVPDAAGAGGRGGADGTTLTGQSGATGSTGATGGSGDTGDAGGSGASTGAAGAAGAGGAGTDPDAGSGGAAGAGDGGIATPLIPRDVDGRITINELMASNALTAADESGHVGDWVELYNPTDVDVPLGGYGVTNDLAMSRKAVLPAALVLRAHDRLLLWLDGNLAAGPAHVPLTLSKDGGAFGLARPDGTYVDRVTFGAQEVDLSAAREPDGAARWVIEWHASPGVANPAGAATDDGQPPGAAPPEDVAVPPEAIPGAGDLSERILGYDVVAQLALTIPPAQWAALQADPDTYVPVTLTYDGRAYGPVGVHLKGMQSFEPIDAKPSLHINIDKFVDDATFFGLKDITLNNMHSDPSMMHERMAYWVARQAGGIPASRANHAQLTVNGQPYGLYTNVETVKKRILRRWFPSDAGALFSATDVDFIAADIPFFELVTGPDDRGLLASVATALTLTDPDQAIAAASAYVDMNEFLRYWASCAVVGQFDSFPYSNPGDDYFAYANPATQRLAFMPWGMDETFLSSAVHIVDRTYAPLARACIASSVCFQAFVDTVWDVLAKAEALGWVAERDRIAAQLAPLIAADTKRQHLDADVAHYQMDMWFFLQDRRAWIAMMIPPRSL